MTLQNVLVAVGPRDEAHLERLLDTVIDLAEPAGARAVLFYALTDEEYDEVLEEFDLDPAGDRLSPTDLASRHLLIERAIDRLERAGVAHDVRGAVGDPATAISDEAADLPADLVVVGGSRRTPAGKAFFGSIPQDVLLSAPCPVVYVRSD